MKPETFVKRFKEIYPMTYESLVDDIERHARKEAAYKRSLKRTLTNTTASSGKRTKKKE